MSVWLKKEDLKVGHIARVVFAPNAVAIMLRVVEENGDEFVGLSAAGRRCPFTRDQVYLACEGLTARDWSDADLVQSACNGGAVAHGLSRVVQRLQAESEFYQLGTEWIQTHPIFRAFLNQLNWLSRMGVTDVFDVLKHVEQVKRGELPVHHVPAQTEAVAK